MKLILIKQKYLNTDVTVKKQKKHKSWSWVGTKITTSKLQIIYISQICYKLVLGGCLVTLFFIVCGQHDSWINSLPKMLTRNCNKIWIKGQFHTWIHYQNDMGMHNLILLHIHIIIYYIGTQLPLKYGYSVEKNMDTILKWHGDKKASLIIWYITNIHSFKLHWDTVVYLNMAAG